MASKALLNFYARLLHKDQVRIEDIDEDLREDVLATVDTLFGDSAPVSVNGNSLNEAE